jgi:hypothetical protein
VEFEIKNCKIVLLDFFKERKKLIRKEMNSSDIQSFLESIGDISIIFSDLHEPENLKQYVKTLNIPEEYLSELVSFFDSPFQSSFSWGFQDQEFVFIRLESSTQLFKKSNLKGLQGLIIHEMMHSVQRQRGLEIRLRDSLDFTLDFFSQLAEIIPEEKYNRDHVISFLKQISQVALFSLKDIFVNVEMIKRGYARSLIVLYGDQLGSEKQMDITPPQYETEFDKGFIRVKDLEEFATAFSYTLALIPVWLPFMVLDTDTIDYTPSRNLKHFIFNKYYTNPSLITREMWHLENTFLTSFSFSKSFHRKWYGAVFNLALEYLLGEDFMFYHLFKATELIEELYITPESEERKSMALVPVLKAAYVYRREQLIGIQERNIKELESKLEEYEISEEEISELEESLEESEGEEPHPEHIFENMLQLSIMIISKDLRQNVFAGESSTYKEYSRTILTLLQAINYLGEFCDDEYYHAVRLGVKRLLRTDNIFKRKKQALLLENFTQSEIFQSDREPTQNELDELMYNLDFFEIPLTNLYIEIGVSFIQNIKSVMAKIPIDDDEFPFLTAQFVNIFLGEMQLPIEDEEHINLIFVSSLIATKGISYNMIQTMLIAFIQARVPPSEN